MSSFVASTHYSPIAVLLTGFITFLGTAGLGMQILMLFGIMLPSPWKQVIGVLLGIEISSLAVQTLGFFGFASSRVLTCIWVVVALMAVPALRRIDELVSSPSGVKG